MTNSKPQKIYHSDVISTIYALDKLDSKLHDNLWDAYFKYGQNAEDPHFKAVRRKRDEYKKRLDSWATFTVFHPCVEKGYVLYRPRKSLDIPLTDINIPFTEEKIIMDDVKSIAGHLSESELICPIQHLDNTYSLLDYNGRILASHCKDIYVYKNEKNAVSFSIQQTAQDEPVSPQSAISYSPFKQNILSALSILGQILPAKRQTQSVNAPYIRQGHDSR